VNVREWLRRVDRIQKGRLFKIIATVVVLLVASGVYTSYLIARANAGEFAVKLAEPEPPEGEKAPERAKDAAAAIAKPPADIEATVAVVNDILKARRDPTGVGVGLALASGLAVAAIWLGLGLTYLAAAVAAVGVLFAAVTLGVGRSYAPVGVGVIILSLAFMTLMELARLITTYSLWLLPLAAGCAGCGYGVAAGVAEVVSGQAQAPASLISGILVAVVLFAGAVRFAMALKPGPVAAIARNVLSEAVRLRLSIFFIVLLIFGLATLPTLLDSQQLLRYRIQSFLQYGTGGSFWLIAVLILTFAVATVAFDQRDKTIWQTMTKPVNAAQYIAGKWLGVSMLSAVLLIVCTSGVYLFTEYLRSQPARGEQNAYVSSGENVISDDRMILETQVLTARRAVKPVMPDVDEAQFSQNVLARAEAIVREQESPADTPEQRAERRDRIIEKVKGDLRKTLGQIYYTITPGSSQVYAFKGLAPAKNINRPLIMRFRVNAGSNPPDQQYRVSFQFNGAEDVQVQTVPLGQYITLPLLSSVVDGEGRVVLQVWNGDVTSRTTNPETIGFPPDGLEISYAAETFRSNFVRVAAVLWVKLAFLAMLGVVTATFLSFAVACMVSFTTFFAAEGALFVQSALENYWTEDREGKTLLFNTTIAFVAQWISGFFSLYAGLRPTGKLVEGLILSWKDVATGTLVLSAWTAVLYLAGVLVLRRRELATYSGQ